MTIQRMIKLLQIEKECITRNDGVNCDRNCAKCDLVQDSQELLEMYEEVINFIRVHGLCQ